MSVADFLFKGSLPPNVTTSTVSETGYPAWFQELQKAIVLRGNQIAGEPYQPYTGQRIAGFIPDQQAGFNAFRSNVGVAQPDINTAGQNLRTGSTFDRGELDKFMSPYTDNVVDRIATLGARNLSEKLLPAVNDQFVASGQYGSTRNQDFVNRALRDTQESILGQQATALESAQNRAMDAYGSLQNRQLAAGEQLGALGRLRQTTGLADAAALQSVGETQQKLGQSSLDLAYGDFQEQRDDPMNKLNQLNSLLRGMNVPTSSTTTSTNPATAVGPSGLQSILALVGGLSSVNNT